MKRALFALMVCLSACGGEEASQPMEIAFQRHELVCDIPNLEAKLQITNVPEICMLEVNDDRTVTGLCPDVPTGDVRAFRLVYFVTLTGSNGPVEVQLATVITTLDLTSETRTLVTVEFSSSAVVTNFNDDNDELSNIVEVCGGRNPLVMDQ